MMTVRILAASEALQLGTDALHRAARLDVAVEQVAGDEEQVDLLREREVDGRGEGGELPLALGAGLLTEVVMPGTEVDVRGVDDAVASGRVWPPWSAGWSITIRSAPCR